MSGCTTDKTDRPAANDNILSLTYTLPGSVQTYAVEATTAENRIYDLYTLFFDPSDANAYIGCQRSSVGSTTNTGSSRVSMPEDYNVMDPWELIFIANIEEYMDDAVTDVAAWLKQQLENKDIDFAVEELMGQSAKAIRSPLLMSGRASKPADTNEVSVELARRVARVDVTNKAPNFSLVSAQLWNARTYGYLMENGNIPYGSSADSYSNYTDNIAGQSNGNIAGQLYAFPNRSIPVTGDIHTTCLIIAGRYTGGGGSGNVTYYRVNVCANGAVQQLLTGNSIYTINISNVTGDGATTPDEAHNKENLHIDYYINEWDDTYNTLYVFDGDGNGLGVSQRFINFSYRGPQQADISVFRIYSDTNPLSGDWNLGAVTGTDASHFTAAMKSTDTVTTGVDSENTSPTDREAEAVLSWGTIQLPLVLNQLSYISQIENSFVSPSTLSFPLTGIVPKEVCVSLQGDFTGVVRSDIETAFVYHDSSDTGWLSIGQGITADDPGMGLFYFNVWPAVHTVEDGVRQAELKFVIRVNGKLSTAQVDIFQTPDSFGDGELRVVEITCMEWDETEQDFINRGSTATLSVKMPGLPVGQSGANHIHFRMVGSEYIKYKMSIVSSMDWQIVASGVTADALEFSQMSGTGNFAERVEVEIKATTDVPTGWDGVFYVEYADGNTTPIVVHQTGIIASVSGGMYYYGLVSINDRLWLDRNLAATAPMDPDNPTVGYHNPLAGYTNNAGRGGYFTAQLASPNPCPAGFRIPKYGTNQGEWDYITDNLTWTGPDGMDGHPPFTFVLPYGPVDDVKYIYWPIGGGSATSTDPTGNYWYDHNSRPISSGVIYSYTINAQTNARGSSNISTSAVQWTYNLRCIYDETL